jgi:polysaccharide export outer membrane protein
VNRLGVVGALALGLACAAAASAQPHSGNGTPYRVGAKDLLEITVFEAPEVNGEYRVADDGSVRLPLVQRIELGGLTEAEAEAKIQQALGRFVNDASVDIELREFRSQPITVIGAVKKPGALRFSERWTLFDAITEAGGLADGHGNQIHVLRRSENGLTDQITVNAEALMVNLDPAANVPLVANDVVNVPATVSLTVYTVGQVATQGQITFTSNERITLLAAIARAGGLTDRASNRLLIKRRTSDGRQEEIKINYKRILAGDEPDIELQAGDVIFVAESFF